MPEVNGEGGVLGIGTVGADRAAPNDTGFRMVAPTASGSWICILIRRGSR